MRPVIFSDEDALVGLLRGRRMALGISQQELDDRIGCPDGYLAKLEAPHRSYGRRAAWGITQTLTWWLESLGLALVVMSKADADRLIAESTDADTTSSQHLAYANRSRSRPLKRQRVVSMRMIFPGGSA